VNGPDDGDTTLSPEEDPFADACREAVASARRMAAGQAGAGDPALPDLARRAAREQAARRDEDAGGWARRLAADVADAND
jgi:hypothetical protein